MTHPTPSQARNAQVVWAETLDKLRGELVRGVYSTQFEGSQAIALEASGKLIVRLPSEEALTLSTPAPQSYAREWYDSLTKIVEGAASEAAGRRVEVVYVGPQSPYPPRPPQRPTRSDDEVVTKSGYNAASVVTNPVSTSDAARSEVVTNPAEVVTNPAFVTTSPPDVTTFVTSPLDTLKLLDQRLGTRDAARELGVSHTLISLVLKGSRRISGKLEKRLIALAESGYKDAAAPQGSLLPAMDVTTPSRTHAGGALSSGSISLGSRALGGKESSELGESTRGGAESASSEAIKPSERDTSFEAVVQRLAGAPWHRTQARRYVEQYGTAAVTEVLDRVEGRMREGFAPDDPGAYAMSIVKSEYEPAAGRRRRVS